MILATRFGDRELRGGDLPEAPLMPRWVPSSSGETVTVDTATGLPALGRAIRLVAGIVGALDLCVFEGHKGDRRERDDSWQAMLLSAPGLEMSAFAWRFDVAAALEACENAFVFKAKAANGEVAELRPIHPDLVRGTVVNGEKRFELWTSKAGRAVFTTAEILHIRGNTVAGGAFGVSRISQHADAIGSEQARNRFEGGFFRNDASPGVVLKFPGQISPEQAREFAELWNQQHAGPGNQRKTGVIGGGGDIQVLPVSLEAAQFVEGKKLGVEEIGRIMDIDPVLLGAEGDRKAALAHFMAVQLPPRLRRIELEVKADPDLFGLGPLYPQFDADPLMFSDPLTRAQVAHLQIQDGTLLTDEARADMGRPPLPDGLGQIPQIVPVGGSPFGVPVTADEPSDT